MHQRFFYHSFPRRGRAVADADELGLKVLESVCCNGLLLVPELVKWHDPQAVGGELLQAHQRRVCFTELMPSELPQHAAHFGSFAIEYSIPSLRGLGALPVIYVPDTASSSGGLDALGTLLLSNLAASVSMLSQIDQIKQAPGNAVKLSIKMKSGQDTERQFSVEETSGIREMISWLEKAEGLDLGRVANSLKRLSNLFYPTERSASSASLEYYRQREWRIISGIRLEERDIAKFPTERQIKQLLQIDYEFFSKLIQFPDKTYSIADKSQFMHFVGGDACPFIRQPCDRPCDLPRQGNLVSASISSINPSHCGRKSPLKA